MTPEQFAYWLQGFAEINGNHPPTLVQWEIISEHLKTVFRKVTPPIIVHPRTDTLEVKPNPFMEPYTTIC